MNMRRWIYTLSACLLVFIALAGTKFLQIRSMIAFAESFPEHSETVAISTAESATYTPTINVMGELKAPHHITLRNELPGRIKSLHVRSGTIVKKGQQLLTLDTSEEAANLKAVNARIQLAKTVYQRHLNLRKSNAVSQEQLDQAKAELTALNAEATAIKSQMRKKQVIAPFDGRLGLYSLSEGEYLPAATPITELTSTSDTLWLDFNIPQFYPPLAVGTAIEFSTMGINDKTQRPEARIIARASAVNRSDRSFSYRAQLHRSDTSLQANSAVNVKVPVATAKLQVRIPATAIQNDNLSQFVYILYPDETISNAYRASRRDITITEVTGQYAILSAGIKAGELIASDGAFKLYPGVLVYPSQTTDEQGES